jgi:hypothetical protein
MYGSPETTRPTNWRELFFMKGEVPPCLITDSREVMGAKLDSGIEISKSLHTKTGLIILVLLRGLLLSLSVYFVYILRYAKWGK